MKSSIFLKIPHFIKFTLWCGKVKRGHPVEILGIKYKLGMNQNPNYLQ